ncbi:4-hydroxythreonine-4-phosphate dehydrogenase PdxA [candidate division KSB1 bacterium]|nr:4-hydroxythreonine-4-phosphate dehydrogenase PdxA [candidate division KSB1 bacterium]
MTYKPLIGITMGDPAGIGPEIAIKAVLKKHIGNLCRPVLIGDAQVFKDTLAMLGLHQNIRSIGSIAEADFETPGIQVLDLGSIDRNVVYGQVAASAGHAAFKAITTAIELAMDQKLDATVTGPINKESLNLAGHTFSGHTEIYAHYTNTPEVAMLLVHGNLRVIHVTTHVPLKKACDLIKTRRIVRVVQLLAESCRMLGIYQPKLGIAGLNPHASDGGLFGTEEQQEIIPAIKELKVLGIDAEGPVPADSLFPKAVAGYYDGCVAMYHDQGHIPFKLMGFTWDEKRGTMSSVKGVNVTLGLPIIRTSVDHGTAFEIAGKGIASQEAMIHAIEHAVNMAMHKMIKRDNNH